MCNYHCHHQFFIFSKKNPPKSHLQILQYFILIFRESLFQDQNIWKYFYFYFLIETLKKLFISRVYHKLQMDFFELLKFFKSLNDFWDTLFILFFWFNKVIVYFVNFVYFFCYAKNNFVYGLFVILLFC